MFVCWSQGLDPSWGYCGERGGGGFFKKSDYVHSQLILVVAEKVKESTKRKCKYKRMKSRNLKNFETTRLAFEQARHASAHVFPFYSTFESPLMQTAQGGWLLNTGDWSAKL